MTSNEIKKALECCKRHKCRSCLFAKNKFCIENLSYATLEYIYQLEANNEALKMDNEQLQSDIVNANGNCEKIQKDCELLKTALAQKIVSEIKSEAIKEFAERLKKHFNPDSSYDTRKYIDNLIKEMVGGEK